MARCWLTTDYDDRERANALGLPYVPQPKRPQDDPTVQAVMDKEQREIERLMAHDAYKRVGGRVRQKGWG